MKIWRALRQDLDDLAELQCKIAVRRRGLPPAWEAFASANNDMVPGDPNGGLFARAAAAAEIAERGQFFSWQALVLFLLSLALVLLFSRMIIGPVKGH